MCIRFILRQITNQFTQQLLVNTGAFTLSLIPIGACEPRWFIKDAHLNPDEAMDQPEIDLAAARKKHNVSAAAFFTVNPGETRTLD